MRDWGPYLQEEAYFNTQPEEGVITTETEQFE